MAIQVIREVSADVVKRGTTRAVYAKQNDFNSRFLNVRIQEDGKDIIVDASSTVMLNVERPDKLEDIFKGTVNDNGTVKVPLTSWMLELAGTLICDISVISEDPDVAKLTTMSFNIYVEEAVVSDSSLGETEEYSVIVELCRRADEAEEKARHAAESAEQVKEACEAATIKANEAAENARPFAEHTENKNNPHGITIGQIGAAPSGLVVYDVSITTEAELDAAVDTVYAMLGTRKVGFATFNVTTLGMSIGGGISLAMIYRCTDQHGWVICSSYNNKAVYRRDLNDGVWGSWRNIGETAFAPSGYGLGTAALTTDWNKATETGFYKGTTNSPNGQWWEGFVIKDSDTHCVQSVWRGSENIHCERLMVGGFWGAWEYVNPPMISGTEYRTTERWQGKVVYTKLVDFGALPNKTMKQVQHGASATYIIRYAATRSDGEAIPFWYDSSTVLIDVSKTGITITTTFDGSAKTAVVQIWYTKD